MSKNPKPTTEELRCVYDLILRGYDDADILAEYASLYENSNLMFPYRTDKRFVRERRKELAAAEDVLKEHVKRQVDPIIFKKREEHFNHLAEIANYLLIGDLEKLLPDRTTDEISGTYTIYNDEEEEISSRELSLRLDRNIENAIHHYGPSDFLDNFLLHLQAECPEIKPGKWDEVVRYNPYILVDAIRILSQRKTFKGTCPVCKDW
ncbi:hypothetical protein ACFLWW_01365 [Chloroflexota bacterium]